MMGYKLNWGTFLADKNRGVYPDESRGLISFEK